jgi:hypothetical protein
LGFGLVFSDPPSVESLCSECGSQGGFTLYFWVAEWTIGYDPPSDGELSGMKVLLLLTSQESQDSQERQNNLKARYWEVPINEGIAPTTLHTNLGSNLMSKSKIKVHTRI